MIRLPAPSLPSYIEGQLPFERSCVQVGEYRMHVMEVGSGRPVLMLHGNPTWGFLYRHVAAALTQQTVGGTTDPGPSGPLRIVVPDLIGLGLSDKPSDAAEHQLDHHAAWLGALIDALDLRDMILVGQDWGGPVGLRALADRPERVAGLVLLNTVVGPPKPNFKATAFHRFAQLPGISDFAFRTLQFPQNVLHRAQGDRSSIRGETARAYRWPLRRKRDRVGPLAMARMVPDSHEHPSIGALQRCQAFVESFDGPSAIVWGDRDPVLGRVRTHIQRLLPRARVTVTDAGHFLQEEVPEQIADAVRYVAEQIAVGSDAPGSD